MEESFHFDLSLSRDLELLRVSRLTDANTRRKSDPDTAVAGTAGRDCVSAGFTHTKGTLTGLGGSCSTSPWESCGDRAERSEMFGDSVMFPSDRQVAPARPPPPSIKNESCLCLGLAEPGTAFRFVCSLVNRVILYYCLF